RRRDGSPSPQHVPHRANVEEATMSRVQALRKEVASPSPRERLRLAIAKRDEAEQRLAKIDAAIERAEAVGSEAWRDAKRAKAALEEARDGETHLRVAAAIGETVAGTSTAEAAAALAKAEARYSDASKTEAALRLTQVQATDSLMWANASVDDAVRVALR